MASGLFPPSPFKTHGDVGWCGDVNSSWWREWCAYTGGQSGFTPGGARGSGRDSENTLPGSKRRKVGGEMHHRVGDPLAGRIGSARNADIRGKRPRIRPPLKAPVAFPPLFPPPVAPADFVESLRPKGAEAEEIPPWLLTLSSNVCLGDEFWACFVHSRRIRDVKPDQVVDWAVQKAKELKLFVGSANAKTDLIWVLELTACSTHRPTALQALRALVKAAAKPSSAERVRHAVRQCQVWKDFDKITDIRPRAPAPGNGAHDKITLLQNARAKVPFSYKPVETKSSLPPLRMPYEGCPETLTVGEFAVGVGCFMAAAVAAGMEGAWMSDLDPDALAVAAVNCPAVHTKLGSMFQQDPNELPWAHVLVGGACCQPFSKMGRQRGWEDERAYSTLRMLHNTATLLPWFLVAENVLNILDIHDGQVWGLIQGVFQLMGYDVQAVRVCPSV